MSKIESEPSIKYQIVLQNQPLIVCFLHKQIISAVKNKYILLLGIHQTSLKETWGQSEGATLLDISESNLDHWNQRIGKTVFLFCWTAFS